MASRDPITLEFGDQSFKVRPLTMGQLEKLETLFADPAVTGSGTKLAREALKIALARDHRDVDVEELECDVRDLPVQLEAVMRLGGFVTAPLEPAPATESVSTGEASEDA